MVSQSPFYLGVFVYSQVIRVTMEKDDMDNYIFCLAQKKAATRLHKDMNDLVSLTFF